jgi:predicted ArsR family transcriptional regulator
MPDHAVHQAPRHAIAELAAHPGPEGTRQHLIRLERKDWVKRRDSHDSGGRSGRPAPVYVIGESGERFFPKQYDELSTALIDTVRDLYGDEALKATLARIVDAKVGAWEPRLAGKSLEQRLQLLTDYYAVDGAFAVVTSNGHRAIEERNCPYLNVALQRPALCSTTVNALTRLLGYQVRRSRKFQNGDGCCEFEVLTDRPVRGGGFEFEPPDNSND